MLLSVMSAAAQAPGVPSEGDQLMSTVIMFGMIFVIFYFFLIRPQQKKFKEHQAMISGVRKNDKIVTSGGIVGKITKVDADGAYVNVEIADKVEIKLASGSISDVLDSKEKASNDNKKNDSKKKK